MSIDKQLVERRNQIADALLGLVPFALQEIVDRAKPTSIHDLTPSLLERSGIIEKLVMAEQLSAGVLGKQKARGELAALARAIVHLSTANGGVKIFGRHWEMIFADGRFSIESLLL